MQFSDFSDSNKCHWHSVFKIDCGTRHLNILTYTGSTKNDNSITRVLSMLL